MVSFLLSQGFSVLVSSIPLILGFLYFYSQGEKEKPLLYALFLGALAVLLALLGGGGLKVFFAPLSLPPWGVLLLQAFISTALLEEGAKFLVITKGLYHKTVMNSLRSFMIYSSLVGLGFASIENLYYTNILVFPRGLLLLREITSFPLHIFSTALLGYYLGISKWGQRDRRLWGFLLASLFHGFYNFFLLLGGYFVWLSPLILLLLILFIKQKATKIFDEGGK